MNASNNSMNTPSDHPLVTVVIVCYEHARYITESIISVIEQTYSPIQLIVIDDGSHDESQQLIAALASAHLFEYVFQTNAGLTAALNKSIELAKGKYFCYLGGDDKMLPNRIQQQVSFMEAHAHYAVYAGNALIIDEHGNVAKKQTLPKARELNFDDIFEHKKAGIRAPTAMIQTHILHEVGGYNPNIPLEDIYMWLKISSKGYLFYVTEDVLSYYRKHSSNQSKNILFMADCITLIYADYKQYPQHDRVLNTLLINLFFKAAKRGYHNALPVLRRVPMRYYNSKVLLGFCYWLINRLKT